MNDSGELFIESKAYTIPTHPNVHGHLLVDVVTGKHRVLLTGSTRADRDDCKEYLNAMLATGHFPPFDWLDEDDVQAHARMNRGFAEVLHAALHRSSEDERPE